MKQLGAYIIVENVRRKITGDWPYPYWNYPSQIEDQWSKQHNLKLNAEHIISATMLILESSIDPR